MEQYGYFFNHVHLGREWWYEEVFQLVGVGAGESPQMPLSTAVEGSLVDF